MNIIKEVGARVFKQEIVEYYYNLGKSRGWDRKIILWVEEISESIYLHGIK